MKLRMSLLLVAILPLIAAIIMNSSINQYLTATGIFLSFIIGSSIFLLWTVFDGYRSGVFELNPQEGDWKFVHALQPKRYWTALGATAILGTWLLFTSAQQLIEIPTKALRNTCYDWSGHQAAHAAIKACSRLLHEGLSSERSSALTSRGAAYYLLGYDLKATADYANAIRLDPKNATAFDDRGLLFLDRRKFDKAIADFTYAHELQPSDNAPLANRGLAYAWLGRETLAERDFAVVRSSDQNNTVVLHGESLLAINSGNLNKAIGLLSDAINHDPNDLWAFTERARIYGRLGKKEKMNADYRAAARVSAGDG